MRDCKIIIVTYNSEKYIQWVLDGLESSKSDLVIEIVDSGSKNNIYLDTIKSKHQLNINKHENIGFVSANNLALKNSEDFKWTLFLNPDARIEGGDLDNLLMIANSAHRKIGVLSVPLVRFDIESKTSFDKFDSLGITSTKYGRWFDISDINKVIKSDAENIFRSVSAVCGALMLVNNIALKNCPDKNSSIGFESSYYMYKEDIELCLRLEKGGWGVYIYDGIKAYHCRGWKGKRSDVPYWAKYHSAINDFDIALRYRPFFIPYSLLKLIWVKFFEKK